MRILKHLPGMPAQSDDHHASWLEVFFDLVFVLAVGELANFLLNHLTLGFGTAATLLAITLIQQIGDQSNLPCLTVKIVP